MITFFYFHSVAKYFTNIVLKKVEFFNFILKYFRYNASRFCLFLSFCIFHSIKSSQKTKTEIITIIFVQCIWFSMTVVESRFSFYQAVFQFCSSFEVQYNNELNRFRYTVSMRDLSILGGMQVFFTGLNCHSVHINWSRPVILRIKTFYVHLPFSS